MKQFRLTFVDSWKRKEIKPLVDKMQLRFSLAVDSQQYSFGNFKTTNLREVRQIMFGTHSLALDLVPKKEVLTLTGLREMKLKAVLQKHKLIKIILDISQKDLKRLEPIQRAKTEGGMRLFRLQVQNGSSLVVGTYGDREGTICFISFHLLYVDLLMSVTELTSVTNPKYCDIDSTFGLHDYQVTVDVRSSSESYLNETFRKVFTKDLRDGYAWFVLVDSDDHTKKFFSSGIKIQAEEVEYVWKSMITNGSVRNLAMMDLSIQDEFGEPWHYTCQPVIIEPTG